MGMNIDTSNKKRPTKAAFLEGLEIVSTTKGKIDSKTEKRLSELTYDAGMMWPAYLATNGEKYHRIFVAKINGKIVGWAMTYWAFQESETKPSKHLHIYISRNHRKKGIGKALWNMSATTSVNVFPHDGISIAFYDAMKKGI